MDHKNWIERRGQYAHIPFSLGPILRNLLLTGLFGYLTAVVYPSYPISGIVDPEFAGQSMFEKFKYIIICSYCLRSRYHFGWHWIQISNVCCGMAYAGGNQWTEIYMADTACEIPWGSTFKQKIDYWNI